MIKKIQGKPHEGFSEAEVLERRKWYDTNARPKPVLRTIGQILCNVLEDPMLRILLAASIATIIIQEIVEEHERSTGKSEMV